MAIRGDLLSVDLSNVFQMLALNRKRGILSIHNRDNILENRSLVLHEDRVALLDVPRQVEINALLVDQGALGYEEYADAEVQSKRFHVRAADYLRKRDIVAPEEIERAEKRLQEELILEIFLWRNVAFSLDEGAEAEEDPSRDFFVVDLVVMEAARRQDEWLRVVDTLGGGNEIYTPVIEANAPEAAEKLDDVARIVFSCLNGVRGTSQIMARTGLPRYHVDLAIGSLVEERFARRMELDDLLINGDRLVEQGKVNDGIRLFKSAVRFDRKSIAIHKRLAAAYLAVDRIAKASAHYKFCALVLMEKDFVREALAIYQYVVSILPTDFKTIERVIDLLSRSSGPPTPDDKQSLDLGIKLFNFYYDTKLYERGEKVLKGLIKIQPDELSLQFSLARIYAKTGRINEAVETYMKLAGRLYDTKDYQGAITVYKTVVSFDTASKEICLEKIAEIRGIMDQKRRRKVAGVAVIMSVCLIVAAAIGYAFYHNLAMTQLEQITSEDGGHETEKAWRAKAARYGDIRRRFPLTKAAFEADRLRNEALEKADDYHAETRERERDAAHRADMLFLDAQENQRRAYQHQVDAELDEALTLYRQALEKAREAGQVGWTRRPEIALEKAIKGIEAHLAEEERRIGLVDEAIEAGRMQEAFELARSMIQPADSIRLDAASIKVVSKKNLERLRVPFRIVTSPDDATVTVDDGTAVGAGGHVLLSAEAPQRTLTVARDGFHSVDISVTWNKDPHVLHVALRKKSDATKDVGHRIIAMKRVAQGLLVTLAHGDLSLRDPTSLEETWRYELGALYKAAAAAVTIGDVAIISTVTGRLRAVDMKTGTGRWRRKVKNAEVRGFTAAGARVLVAIGGETPRLGAFGLDKGRHVWDVPLDHDVAWVVASGGVAMTGGPNGASIVDVARGKVLKTVEGAFASAVVHDGSFWAIDGGRTLCSWRVDAPESETRVVLAHEVTSGPWPAGRDLLCVLPDGGLARATRTGLDVNEGITPGLLDPKGSVQDLGDGRVLAGGVQGGLVLLHPEPGSVSCLFRWRDGIPAWGVREGTRLLIGFGSSEGKIQSFGIEKR